MDPTELLIHWLRLRPEISCPVASDQFGHNAGDPLIMIDMAGGFQMVRDVMDRWDMVIHYYGPDKSSVAQLAKVVRPLLLKTLRAERVEEVVVLDVLERHAPSNNPDPLTGEQRYLHGISVFLN